MSESRSERKRRRRASREDRLRARDIYNDRRDRYERVEHERVDFPFVRAEFPVGGGNRGSFNSCLPRASFHFQQDAQNPRLFCFSDTSVNPITGVSARFHTDGDFFIANVALSGTITLVGSTRTPPGSRPVALPPPPIPARR